MAQTLQAEARKYMSNHYTTRLWALRSQRIDDVMYFNIFFSNITSIRGYTCFQLFAYKYSKFVRIELMKQEEHYSKAYEGVIRSAVAPKNGN